MIVTPNGATNVYNGTTLNNASYSTNPANYTITGFQNSDTANSIGLAFTGSLAFNGSTNSTVKNAGTYAITNGTLALAGNVTNYALFFDNPQSHAYVVTAKALALTGLTANNKTADGTQTASFTGAVNLLAAETAGSGSTGDGKPYSGDSVGLTGATNGTFATASAGTNIAVTVSGLSLSGTEAPNYTLSPLVLSANIAPAAIDHYHVTLSPPPQYAGVPFTTYATAKDAYGNTVTSDSSTVVTFTSTNSATMKFDGNGDYTYENYGTEYVKTLVNGVAGINTKDNVAEKNIIILATDANAKTGFVLVDVDSGEGAYRTKTSGNWNNPSTWEVYAYTTTNVVGSATNIVVVWTNALVSPTFTNGVITVRPTNLVTVTANVGVDQLHVEAGGGLVISPGVTLAVAANNLPGLELYGSLTNNGTLVISNAPDLVVMAVYETGTLLNSGTVTPLGILELDGLYVHDASAAPGTIPTAIWDVEATCEVIGYTNSSTPPAGLNQSFWNFVWNCPGQNSRINLGTDFTTAQNFTNRSTGTGLIVLGTNLNVAGTTWVASGSYLDCASQVISGGSFFLSSGGTLGIGSTGGIATNGAAGNIETTNRSFSTGGNYVYDGSAAQVTGSGLPATVNSLTDANTGGTLTLAQAVNVTASLSLTNAGSAKINLPAGTTSTAANLVVNGVSKSAGSWGSTSSSAQHANDSYFAATTGILNVSLGVPTMFTILTASQQIYYGTTSVTLSGTLSGVGTGETVTVTVDLQATNVTTTSGGNFTVNFNPATIPHNNYAPHPIAYSYAASPNYNSASDDSTLLTVQAVALNITADSANKTYGQTYTAVGAGQTAFSSSGLVNGETIGSVAMAAAGGTAANAPVGLYALVPGAATGGTFTPDNYNIVYINGALTVLPATLSVTATNLSKTYGQTLIFAGTEIATAGLQNGETVTNVTLTSDGAVGTADAGLYSIIPSTATGGNFAATNYTITYNEGTLTVNKATPVLTPPTASAITYGQTLGSSTLSGGAATNSANNASVDGAFDFTAPDVVLPAGTTNAEVTFNPSASHNYNSAATTIAVTVSQAATVITLTSSAPTNGYRDDVSFNAALPADATGSIQFKTNGVALSSSNLVAGVAFSLGTTNLPRGTNLITAEYAGDSNYLGSTNSMNQMVTNHPPTIAEVYYVRTAGLRLRMFWSELATNWSDADLDGVTNASINLTTTNGVLLTTNSLQLLYPNTAPNVNDRFSYTVTDSYGESSVGYVNVVVNPFVSGQQITTSPGNPYSVTYFGHPGYSYLLQRSTNLFAGSGWVSIRTNTISSTGRTNIVDDFSDLGATPSQAYYRVGWKSAY